MLALEQRLVQDLQHVDGAGDDIGAPLKEQHVAVVFLVDLQVLPTEGLVEPVFHVVEVSPRAAAPTGRSCGGWRALPAEPCR